MELSPPPDATSTSTLLAKAFQRLQDLIGFHPFTFVINGTSVDSCLLTAVLLSPAVHKLLTLDSSTNAFVICDGRINCADLAVISALILGACVSVSRSSRRSLVLLSRSLGNVELEELFLSAWDCPAPDSGSESSADAISVALSTIPAGGRSSKSLCASQFFRYSVDDLSLLDVCAVEDLLLSEALRLESEDALVRLLSELGGAYLKLLCHVRVEFLSSSGLSDFFDRFDGSWVTDSLWNSLRFALAGIRDSDLESRRFTARHSSPNSIPKIDSLIVSSLPNLFLSEFAGKQYFLLYRGSRDGFNAADFHRQCDGHERTVVLIQDSNGYLFGGYTPLAWRNAGGTQPDPSLATFVFTLTNPHGIAPRKFTQLQEKRGHAIFCDRNYGPVFGGTIYTMDSCNRSPAPGRYNFTGSFGNYFLNDSGVDQSLLFTGWPTFVVREMEVFELRE